MAAIENKHLLIEHFEGLNYLYLCTHMENTSEVVHSAPSSQHPPCLHRELPAIIDAPSPWLPAGVLKARPVSGSLRFCVGGATLWAPTH